MKDFREWRHILIDRFPFGKYKGQSISEIAERDPRYVGWFHGRFSNVSISQDVLDQVEDCLRDIDGYGGYCDGIDHDTMGCYGSENLYMGFGDPWGDN